MSLYQKASLVQIPSGYKAADDKLYSVVPNNGDGDFTVTVAAGATRVNKDGLIESVAADQARLNYDPTNPQDPHLLLEPSRTNSIIQSEDLGTSWSTFNGGSISTNESTSPDGSLTADKLSTNGTSFSFVKPSTNPTISTGNNTFTIFAKADTSDELWLRLDYGTTIYNRKFNLTTQTISTGFDNTGNIPDEETIEDYGNGWYRLRITDSADTTSFDPRIYVADATSTSGDSVFLWGAQVEAASYPTSYIPTTTGAETRTVDKCFNAGDANLFNDSEGTLFVDLENLDATATEITLGNGSSSNRITFLFYGSTFGIPNKIRFLLASGGTNQVDSFYTISYTFNQRNKIAFRYKQNDFKAYINGTQVFSDTSGNTPVGLSRFDFANSNATSGFIEGEINQTMVFNEALSDSELQTLTS